MSFCDKPAYRGLKFCSTHYKHRGRPYKTVIEKIFEKITLNETSGCWEYNGAKTRDGYGTYHDKGSNGLVHRRVYGFYYKNLPSKKFLCHHCDNPACCNPSHLFIGNSKSNMVDAKEKGRLNRGEDRWSNKLKEHEVRAIREDTRTVTEIAKIYNVSISTISAINHKRIWAWLL